MQSFSGTKQKLLTETIPALIDAVSSSKDFGEMKNVVDAHLAKIAAHLSS